LVIFSQRFVAFGALKAFIVEVERAIVHLDQFYVVAVVGIID